MLLMLGCMLHRVTALLSLCAFFHGLNRQSIPQIDIILSAGVFPALDFGNLDLFGASDLNVPQVTSNEPLS